MLFSRRTKHIKKALPALPKGYKWKLTPNREEPDHMFINLMYGKRRVDWSWFHLDGLVANAVECGRWIVHRNQI